MNFRVCVYAKRRNINSAGCTSLSSYGLFALTSVGYSLVFTTPYVFGRYDGHFVPADLMEWQAFLDRNVPRIEIAYSADAYAHLMKYGISRNYWNDYLMDAFVNYRPDMIMLAGIPDVPASLPHDRGPGL